MEKRSIKQIEHILMTIEDDSHPFLLEIKGDGRKGVQNLLLRWEKQKEKADGLKNKFYEMNYFERKFRNQGYKLIAGIDEVGRGPLAGPVVAAAVILSEDFFLPGLDDSKKLSEKKREEYASFIQKNAISISVAMIGPLEIDQINIYEATKKAMLSAVESLKQKPDFLLIDAMKLDTPYSSESIIKGDAKSVSIAAASIVAKVTRDRLMKDLGKSYPPYHFEQNMGYGTKEHLQAIENYGITPYHRKSFAPIKEMVFE
ncbi:MAG: ribonuclease HII [Bacillota bacterium]|nr:ribonuclease HII [Bacillota bacterium]